MKIIAAIILFIYAMNISSQTLVTSNKKINEAFKLAVQTIDQNTHDGILAAGADYGGEWTRDISINSLNGVSLLRPDVAEKSLWSVTVNKDTIGHQYWDKIIWVIAALNHYKVNGNIDFLKQAYTCSKNTIEQLEASEFDNEYGLFKGPSVFNDGIAGYPEPIYDKNINHSFVLEHPSKEIKCLSTNCIYYGSYFALSEMAIILGTPEDEQDVYLSKADKLKANIIKHFYNSNTNEFSYVIDDKGKTYNYQEGLGISFAILLGITDSAEVNKIIPKIHSSLFGIPSIYPDFPYFTPDKPGRHNNIIWPFINGFWALACLNSGAPEKFYFELLNLASLAIDEDKGNFNFREIYNPYTGKPDGGWQLGSHWESCNHQTWSATAFIAMIIKGLAGMEFKEEGIFINPYLPDDLNQFELNGLEYRDAILNISIQGSGKKVNSFKINEVASSSYMLPSNLKGSIDIEIEMSN